MKSVVEIADRIRSGKLRAVDIVSQCIGEIETKNSKVNAFIYLDREGAMKTAQKIDALILGGEDPGLLAGVPFGIKDLRETCVGMPTKNGSIFFNNTGQATTDTPMIKRLKKAGAIPLGKVATAEFGMDGVTHTKAFGTTRNPWNLESTPGGSSGGSSSAVSAGMVPFCTGSDGGGSIRCPAGYTGLVGLKPSHGRISRSEGTSDKTCIGVLTTTVADTARILDLVSGPDNRDRMSLPPPNILYEKAIETLDLSGLRAVWSEDLGYAPVEPEVVVIAHRAARRLGEIAKLSFQKKEVAFTNTYIESNLLMTEMFVHQLEVNGILPDRINELSRGPKRFVEIYYSSKNKNILQAIQKEKQLQKEIANFFQDADILLTPTNSCGAYAAEGPMPEVIAGKDARRTHAEPFTMPANIGWNPSISVPAGFTSEGLPVGLLITGKRFQDEIILMLAHKYELNFPWPHHPPGW